MAMYTRCTISLMLKPSAPQQVLDWLHCMVKRDDDLWAAYHARKPEDKYGGAKELLCSRRGSDMFGDFWDAEDAHSTLQDLYLSVVSYFTHYDNEILKFVGCIGQWVDRTQPWSITSVHESHCPSFDPYALDSREVQEHTVHYMLPNPVGD